MNDSRVLLLQVLRQCLDFGLVRLKLFLAIQREPILDVPGWEGRFVAHIGHRGQVKTHILPPEPEPTEVIVEQ